MGTDPYSLDMHFKPIDEFGIECIIESRIQGNPGGKGRAVSVGTVRLNFEFFDAVINYLSKF